MHLTSGTASFLSCSGRPAPARPPPSNRSPACVEIDAGRCVSGGRSNDRCRAVPPQRRDGVRELCAVPAEDGVREPRLATAVRPVPGDIRRGRAAESGSTLVTTTLGINHLLRRFPRELSNGQRQRVALGRVLVRPADVVPAGRAAVPSGRETPRHHARRTEAARPGCRTPHCLYVTHDYQEALALGNRIAVLRAGRIVQLGTPEEMWREPTDTFVAKALGSRKSRCWTREVLDGRVRAGSVDLPVPDRIGLCSGDRVRLGMRPRRRPAGRPEYRADSEKLHCRGRVRLAERLGRQVELSVRRAGAT